MAWSGYVLQALSRWTATVFRSAVVAAMAIGATIASRSAWPLPTSGSWPLLPLSWASRWSCPARGRGRGSWFLSVAPCPSAVAADVARPLPCRGAWHAVVKRRVGAPAAGVGASLVVSLTSGSQVVLRAPHT